MGGKVVNLRTVKKQRARDEARREAGHDPEGERRKAEAELEARRLDGHRRDAPET